MIKLFQATFLLLISTVVYAQDIKVVTWNLGAPEAEEVMKRNTFLDEASQAMNADVYILQELTHMAQLQEVADLLNLSNVDMALSNFDIFHSIKFFALEVGVISKIPITSVIEFDPQNNDNTFDKLPFFVSEIGSTPTLEQKLFSYDPIPDEDLSSIANPSTPSGGRGFLRVELENGMIVYAVHFKSSGLGACREISDPLFKTHKLIEDNEWLPAGHEILTSAQGLVDEYVTLYEDQTVIETSLVNETRDSARKREHMAMKIVSEIANDELDDKTIIVAGDINTPWAQDCVRGSDYKEDTKVSNIKCSIPWMLEGIVNPIADDEGPQCDARDGYDDTHAILTGNNDHSIALDALAKNLNHRTYVKEGFAESPIDHIYVIGKDSDKFSDAEIPQEALDAFNAGDTKVWGTDHFPLITTFSP